MLTVLAGGGCEGIHKNIYCSTKLELKLEDTQMGIQNKECSSSSNKHNSPSKKGWYYGVDTGSRTSLKGRGELTGCNRGFRVLCTVQIQGTFKSEYEFAFLILFQTIHLP